MLAYKGFNSNLTCTMGKGTFQYEQGVKYTEENAHCGADGFHATDDPLGVLSYYNKSDDRYFLVELGGNIDEDGVNSRISAPEITLMRELSKTEMYMRGLIWMSRHPKAKIASVVREETGDAAGSGYVIVRGKHPKARGSRNDIRTICSEDGRHKSCVKTQKNIKESLQQQKQISRDYSVRSMCRVSFADMNHEWMCRARRAIKNGADSMQSGKECQMDEKDAISILNMIEAHGALPVKAKEMAINVLEEVQQYRAIGTPKKIKDLLEKAAEKIENLYGRETQLSEEIRKSLDS